MQVEAKPKSIWEMTPKQADDLRAAVITKYVDTLENELEIYRGIARVCIRNYMKTIDLNAPEGWFEAKVNGELKRRYEVAAREARLREKEAKCR